MPHPLADRAAWAAMIAKSEADFISRVEAEKTKSGSQR
jgi:hypothetical protein